MTIPSTPPPPHNCDEIITKGRDAGKTVGELYDEVFDASVSDEEYLHKRLVVHFGQNAPKDSP